MARPKKDNADYFSHDSDMRNDLKIKALRRKYSHTGYAVYNYMLELLTDSDFFEHNWDDLNIEIISGDFNIEPEKLKEIIEYCSSILELFTIENGLIWCNTLRKRFDSLLSKRKRDRFRVIASENPQSKVKESKVKKSKVDKFTLPTPLEVENYGLEKGHKLDGKKICDYYTVENPNKWIDKKGEEVKSWKRKVLSVWCKEENKIKKDSKGNPEKQILPESERIALDNNQEYVLGAKLTQAVTHKWITIDEAIETIISDPNNKISHDTIRRTFNR